MRSIIFFVFACVWTHSLLGYDGATNSLDASVYRELSAAREFLLEADPKERTGYRFLSLRHQSQNAKKYNSSDLAITKNAVAKCLNSLTWEPRLYVPEVVDGTDGTLLVINLKKLGWKDHEQWNALMRNYPYGLRLETVSAPELLQAARDLQQLAQCDVPILRADWFVHHSMHSPIYESILGMSHRFEDLELRLGVSTEANLQTGKAIRASVSHSKIAQQNRMIERHDTDFGALWLAFDFLPRRGRGDLLRYPFGPCSPNNPFPRLAFEHDFVEVLFSLPNSFLAFAVFNKHGELVTAPVPLEIAFDSQARTGTPEIRMAASCIQCHERGIQGGYRDDFSVINSFSGDALAHLKRSHIDPEKLDAIILRDQKQFFTAMRTVMLDGSVAQDVEPISHVVCQYLEDLDQHSAGYELGLVNLAPFQKDSPFEISLRKLGLAPLIHLPDAKLKRSRWEALDGTSLFQDVAVDLRLGTPILCGGLPSSAKDQSRYTRNRIEP
ncbi:hypothetical protein SH449x_002083 [Pirellulaceae bacterium SH449]